MRTGILAEKLGMTRVFADDGSHVPVSVLRVEACEVVAARRPEVDGHAVEGPDLGLLRSVDLHQVPCACRDALRRPSRGLLSHGGSLAGPSDALPWDNTRRRP